MAKWAKWVDIQFEVVHGVKSGAWVGWMEWLGRWWPREPRHWAKWLEHRFPPHLHQSCLQPSKPHHPPHTSPRSSSSWAWDGFHTCIIVISKMFGWHSKRSNNIKVHDGGFHPLSWWAFFLNFCSFSPNFDFIFLRGWKEGGRFCFLKSWKEGVWSVLDALMSDLSPLDSSTAIGTQTVTQLTSSDEGPFF